MADPIVLEGWRFGRYTDGRRFAETDNGSHLKQDGRDLDGMVVASDTLPRAVLLWLLGIEEGGSDGSKD